MTAGPKDDSSFLRWGCLFLGVALVLAVLALLLILLVSRLVGL